MLLIAKKQQQLLTIATSALMGQPSELVLSRFLTAKFVNLNVSKLWSFGQVSGLDTKMRVDCLLFSGNNSKRHLF